MKRETCLCLMLFGLAAAPAAQQLPPPPTPANPRDLPLDSGLYRAAQRVAPGERPTVDLRAELERAGYAFDGVGRVHVEVVRPAGVDTPLGALVAAHGGVLDRQVPGRADVWAPVDRLPALARALAPGETIVPVYPLAYDDVVGEGRAVTNSATYVAGGAGGAGRTIAIVDGGYANLTQARVNGDAPPIGSFTAVNYTPNPFEDGTTHGTGCVEAAFDHAPGALYRIYRIDSPTDVQAAMTDAVANGTDVVSMSMSFYNLGWADNSGAVCTAAYEAVNNGLLFFTSAGNRAQSHYQGFVTDANGNDWTEFSGTADETIGISVADDATLQLRLAWDTFGGTYDLDLYLYDDALTTVLASSTNGSETFEAINWKNESGGTQTVNVAVFHVSGGATEFEIFDHNGGTWLEHMVATSSTTSPSNTVHPNLVSVAAVTQSLFGSAPGANVIRGYSSRGPSNGGVTKPDLAGPTDTTGFTYPSTFGGTSCATPNVAGAATALWSADPLLDASAVRYLLQQQALLYRDWGPAGDDLTYGAGGLRLVDFAPNTLWLDRDYGNVGDLRSAPFHTLQAAHDQAAAGGRILCLNAPSYPEAALLTTPLTIETLDGPKTFGP